jgi:hypothetical protein
MMVIFWVTTSKAVLSLHIFFITTVYGCEQGSGLVGRLQEWHLFEEPRKVVEDGEMFRF